MAAFVSAVSAQNVLQQPIKTDMLQCVRMEKPFSASTKLCQKLYGNDNKEICANIVNRKYHTLFA